MRPDAEQINDAEDGQHGNKRASITGEDVRLDVELRLMAEGDAAAEATARRTIPVSTSDDEIEKHSPGVNSGWPRHGLPILHSPIQALNDTIEHNDPEGGAIFRSTLPCGIKP